MHNLNKVQTKSVKKDRNYPQKFFSFLQCQLEQISVEGLVALLRKVYCLLLIPFAVPAVLIVRSLQPLAVIRFGPLHSRRIGHFAVNTEIYLCERDAGMHSKRTYDIFYYLNPVSNYQLKKMWDRVLHVSQFSNFIHLVDRLNRLLPGYESHVIPMPLKKCRDINGFFSRMPPHLFFTAEEERQGREALRKIGIPEEASFICFIARDSLYLNTMYPSYNWSYHDYRDSTVGNYISAAEELVRRGYFTIRMGAIVKESLNTTNPMIIDYATKHRDDFLDIYLSAKCVFYIASNSGLDEIPAIFRRPIVCVNYIPLEYVPTWNPVRLFILKKLWLRKEGRFLTFREILNLGISRWVGRFGGEKYEQFGIDIMENTPEEITAVVVEMDERLKGTWQMSEEDEELQRRFWSLFKQSELHGKIETRIGAEFLRQNRELLN